MPDQAVEISRLKRLIPLEGVIPKFQSSAGDSTWISVARKLTRAMGAYGTAADEMIFTPNRDTQVFASGRYSHWFGHGHAGMNLFGIAFSLIAAIPFIAKTFNENQVNSLEKVVANLHKETRDAKFSLADNVGMLNAEAVDYLSRHPEYYEPGMNPDELALGVDRFKSADELAALGIDPRKTPAELTALGIDPLRTPEELAAAVAKAKIDMAAAIETAKKPRDKNKQTLDDENSQYIHIFNAYLFKKGYKNLRAYIVVDPKNNTKRLEFEFHDPSFDIFVEYWDLTKDMKFEELKHLLVPEKYKEIILVSTNQVAAAASVDVNAQQAKQKRLIELQRLLDLYSLEQREAALEQIQGVFFEKKEKLSPLYPDDTLEECFKERVNKLINAPWYITTLSLTYNVLSKSCFAFWLAFFPVDILENQADFTQWKKPMELTGVLIATAAFAGIDLCANAVDYLLTRSGLKNASEKKKLRQEFVGNFYDIDAVRHDVLTSFFLDCKLNDHLDLAAKDLQKKAARPGVSLKPAVDVEQNIKTILTATSCKQVERVNLGGKYVRDNYAADTYERLKEDTAPRMFEFKRLFLFADKTVNMSIIVSFIGWFLAAVLFKAGVVAVAAALLSNPGGIALFTLGAIIGIGYAAYTVYNDRANEKKRDAAVNGNRKNLAALQVVLAQNAKLEALIIANGDKPLTGTKASKDNVMRRLTTKIDPKSTFLKKAVNWFCTAVGRAGSAILVVRLVAMPAYAVHLVAIGITIGVASTFLGPLGLGLSIPLCALWAGLNLWQYHKQSKLREAQRCLNDIENRLQCERNNQEIYLQQLGYNKEERDELRVPVAPPVLSVVASDDSNLAVANAKAGVTSAARASESIQIAPDELRVPVAAPPVLSVVASDDSNLAVENAKAKVTSAARASEPIQIAPGEQSAHVNGMSMFSSVNSQFNSSPPKSVASTPSPERRSPDSAVVDGANNADAQTVLQMNMRAAGDK